MGQGPCDFFYPFKDKHVQRWVLSESPAALLPIHFSATASGKAAGGQPEDSWETWVDFLAPGFSLTQACLLPGTWGSEAINQSLLTPCHSTFQQINQ